MGIYVHAYRCVCRLVLESAVHMGAWDFTVLVNDYLFDIGASSSQLGIRTPSMHAFACA